MRGEEEEDFVELDLERTVTWTGNAVSIHAGGEFRLPLIVPHPSILAIQFEVEGGQDIEFSLSFKDDQEEGSSVLVEPVRVADREGQLDIDTTGLCEILWSNQHAWMTSKVLSYQLQLAPKVNTQMRRFRTAVIAAADDYRVLAAAEAADEVDRTMRTLKQRTIDLQNDVTSTTEKEVAAAARHERYLSHVKRLEEEVAAAKAHAEQAAVDLAMAKRETILLERKLKTLTSLRTLDDAIDKQVLATLSSVDEALDLLFEAYAGAMYPPDSPDSSEVRIDRAELIHLLMDFGIMGRGPPPEEMCGVFVGYGQSLNSPEFKRCLARAAIVLAPIDDEDDIGRIESGGRANPPQSSDEMLRWMLSQLPSRIVSTKLPVLDVQRRVRVLAAAEHLQSQLE